MENRLPIELARDYNLYKQAIINFYIDTTNCLSLKKIEEIEAEMVKRQEKLEERNKNSWIGRI